MAGSKNRNSGTDILIMLGPYLPILIERGCLARLAGSKNMNSRTDILSLVPGIMEKMLVQIHFTLIGDKVKIWVDIKKIHWQSTITSIFLGSLISQYKVRVSKSWVPGI